VKRRQHLYLGKSGQMAVMAEFLARGYNVAVPEVDLGDDIFVVRDSDGQLSRIQVKTASARETAQGFSARFAVPLQQLQTPVRPEVHYVLAVRHQERWAEYVLLSRPQLFDEVASWEVGSQASGSVVLYLSFTPTRLVCSDRDWQDYRNNWATWPSLVHG
jgi:hypothetical protein